MHINRVLLSHNITYSYYNYLIKLVTVWLEWLVVLHPQHLATHDKCWGCEKVGWGGDVRGWEV